MMHTDHSLKQLYTVTYSTAPRLSDSGEQHCLWIGRAYTEVSAIERFIERARGGADPQRDCVWLVRALNVQKGLDFSTKAAEALISDALKVLLIQEKFQNQDREVFLSLFDGLHE